MTEDSPERRNECLKAIIAERREESKKLLTLTMSLITGLLLPQLEEFNKGRLTGREKAILQIALSGLRSILFVLKTENKSFTLTLTPSDLMVAALIKEGLTTKEISQNTDLSRKQVERCREKIRIRLGIKAEGKEKGANLRNILQKL